MTVAATDSVGMFGLARALPEQAEHAAAVAATASLDSLLGREFRNVVALGMGGSGIGLDVLAAVALPVSPVPITVVKDHALPAAVGRDSLVLATSFSGNTAETLDAFDAARAAGAAVVAFTTGGELGRRAQQYGAPVVELDRSIAMPRAAIASVALSPIVIVGRLGLLPGYERAVAAAIEQLHRRVAALAAPGSAAETLARRIGRTIPLVYGAGGVGGVAAYRWKCQVNENAKSPAFYNVVPEQNHNEIAGWGQHGDITRQVLTAIHLRHDFEPPRVAQSFGFINEVQEEIVAAVHEVHAEGDGRLAQLFDLVAVGDFVSLHLAAQEGVDPGPIPVLDELKRRLG